ncbi:MAG TPA: hypothetical protein VGI75_12385 [Pirellulales bacterium]|jgi:hypothetical protein
MQKDRPATRLNRNITFCRRAIERLESRTVLSASSIPYAPALIPLAGKDGAMNPPSMFAAGSYAGMDGDRMSNFGDPSDHFAGSGNNGNAFSNKSGSQEPQFYYFTGPNEVFVVAGYGNQFEVIQMFVINNGANYGSSYGANSPEFASPNSRPELAPPSAPGGFVGPSADPTSHNAGTHGGDAIATNNLRSTAGESSVVATPSSSQTVFAAAHINSNSTAVGSLQTALMQLRVVFGSQDRLAVHSADTAGALQALPTTPESKLTDLAAQQDVHPDRSNQGSTQIASAYSESTCDFANAPITKASLIGLPFDLAGVEHAVQRVMSEIETIGTKVSTWLDEAHLLPLAAAVAAVSAGAGAAYYVRRGRAETVGRWEDEPSSSWLFLRLQPHPGE